MRELKNSANFNLKRFDTSIIYDFPRPDNHFLAGFKCLASIINLHFLAKTHLSADFKSRDIIGLIMSKGFT